MNEQYKFQNNELGFKEIMLLIKYWFLFFYKKKNILLFFFLAGSVIGYIQVKNEKPKYTATISYVLEEASNSSSNNTLNLMSQIGISGSPNNGGGIFSSSILIELMKSRSMIQKILLRPVLVEKKYITLAEYYIQTNNLREKWKKNIEYKNIKFEINSNPIFFTPQQVEVISNIYNDLVSKKHMLIGLKSKEDAIPQISITNEHELFAKLFCENLLAGTSEFYIETKSKRAKKNLKNLEEQLDSVRRKYNNSLTLFATSSESLFNLNTANKIKSTTSLNRQIDVQSLAALLPPLIANIENAKATLTNATPLFQIIETPILPLPKEKPSFFKVILLYSTTFFLTIMTILFLLHYYTIKIKLDSSPLQESTKQIKYV